MPPEKPDRPSAFAGAATAALPSAADAAASAMGSEVVIASAETRKSLKAPTRTEPASTAPAMSASPSAAAPNPFPAEVSEAGAAAPQKSNQVANRARAAPISDLDVAMFRAVRAGDIPGLRVAISRGANVNGNDERGRTALQIARERADIETIKVLETAGARP